MVLSNVEIVGLSEQPTDIEITGSRISKIRGHDSDSSNHLFNDQIRFSNAIAFPGLINSHDHLEFNLYPALGHQKYRDYIEWGEDIHKRNKELIQSIEKIPLSLRLHWGIYKNLVNGVTTVMHHGRHFKELKNALIDIISRSRSIHSVRLGKQWKRRLILSPKFHPIAIHVGEGTGEDSKREIDELIRWNISHRKLIGVHGIPMTKDQAKFFKALIWCPVSNHFLFGETAKINMLKKQTEILFGTDSTLTADWNIWNHLRLARELKLLDDEELFKTITVNPASVWKLGDRGKIAEGRHADLVVARRKFENLWDSLYATNPEDILLIVKNGNIALVDAEIFDRLKSVVTDSSGFSKINVNGKSKYLPGNIKNLFESIRSYYSNIQLPITLE